MTLRPCIECGEPTETERCEQHRLIRNSVKTSAYERGYDHAWRKLSERARRLQPFCSDCGATDDLQTDHSPEAWARKAAGKAIRLCDVDVVCGPCNRNRGAARGHSEPVGGIPGQGYKRPNGGSQSFDYTPSKREYCRNKGI